jgi:hypothetical protein
MMRPLHYKPEGNAFRMVEARRRFNRSLYSTNTAFRIEAGDLPEFALYLPGMGGNIRFALLASGKAKWIIHTDSIQTRYSPERMDYVLRDAMLGTGQVELSAIAMRSTEGLMIKATAYDLPQGVELVCVYGGVSDKKFSRDGDVGADPENVFFLQPSYCSGNNIRTGSGGFTITDQFEEHVVSGTMPPAAALSTIDFSNAENADGLLKSTKEVNAPVLAGKMPIAGSGEYFFAWMPGPTQPVYAIMAGQYRQELNAIAEISKRVVLSTPDEWMNNLGGVLANAADAIWDDPTYVHGAVAWRMRLPGWRGAYVADPLGWHNRARTHFSAYAKSQITSPATGPVVMDTALNLARHQEKMGNAVFSSGYICRNPNGDMRPHHYDMNLVFIDQLLTHFKWTGDTAYICEMWPVIVRHLDWEKRNFDADGDGLYDAYCCIWASDALQYSAGGVAHSSAYNYRAFSEAAQLAKLIGADGSAYEKEAQKILKAMRQKLWLPANGWFAEYKDALGNQLVHAAAALWTVYHTIDSKVPNPFEAWQMTNYVENHIPRIPFTIKGLPDTFHVLSTTNWMPYTWSINNVAMGELMHTALAYWQAGRTQEAYKLWRSTLMESLYCGAGAGSFHQLLKQDAMRGELYRDFADGVGMVARALVEGMFGINVNALTGELNVKPGYPQPWKQAGLKLPDVEFAFEGANKLDKYTISQHLDRPLALRLQLPAKSAQLPTVVVNGQRAKAVFLENNIGEACVEITAAPADKYSIEVRWVGTALESSPTMRTVLKGDTFGITFKDALPQQIVDPQQVLQGAQIKGKTVAGIVVAQPGRHCLFVKRKQQDATWWQPVEIIVTEPANLVGYQVQGNVVQADVAAAGINRKLSLPLSSLLPGTNKVPVSMGKGKTHHVNLQTWAPVLPSGANTESVNLESIFNAPVADLFKQQYLEPRPTVPTLQLPTQGIGNWCYPQASANISDSGLRKLAAQNGGRVTLPQGISFAVDANRKQNIAFVSMWNNYPQQLSVPAKGMAKHAWLLMAGTTNHMQSRITNGLVLAHYTDGTSDTLPLVNPENWWPIEQDYFEDGLAFARSTPRPPRIHLGTGYISDKPLPRYSGIKGFSSMAIEGGAATVVDMPLNPTKELKQFEIKAVANDVVIGLMGLTLLK